MAFRAFQWPVRQLLMMCPAHDPPLAEMGKGHVFWWTQYHFNAQALCCTA